MPIDKVPGHYQVDSSGKVRDRTSSNDDAKKTDTEQSLDQGTIGFVHTLEEVELSV